MGSITKTSRVDKATGKTVTVHRAYIRREGFASKSKVCATVTEAKKWIRDNESAATLTKGSGGKTFSKLIEDFVLAPAGKGTKYWEPAHLEFWQSQIGGMKISEISRGDINAAKAKLQNKFGLLNTPNGVRLTTAKITPATVNRYLASLASVFNYALQHDIIDTHPMKGGKVSKLTEGAGRTRILTPAEEAALMSAANTSSWPMMPLFFRVMVTTAARKSEVLKLRWRDVRLDESVAIVGKTKNGEARALPLVDDVREALAAVSKVRPLHSDFVFYDPKHPERPKNVDSVWKTCRAAAGLLNDRDDKLDCVVLHTTRHTGVTKMLRGGANVAQAAAVSGHKTLSMLNRYSHLSAQDSVDLAKRLLAG